MRSGIAFAERLGCRPLSVFFLCYDAHAQAWRDASVVSAFLGGIWRVVDDGVRCSLALIFSLLLKIFLLLCTAVLSQKGRFLNIKATK